MLYILITYEKKASMPSSCQYGKYYDALYYNDKFLSCDECKKKLQKTAHLLETDIRLDIFTETLHSIFHDANKDNSYKSSIAVQAFEELYEIFISKQNINLNSATLNAAASTQQQS